MKHHTRIIVAVGLAGALAGCSEGDDSARVAQGAPVAATSPSSAPPPSVAPGLAAPQLPATNPLAGVLTEDQRVRPGLAVPASTCRSPEIAAAVAPVLGYAVGEVGGSMGGYLTDTADETEWALEYAGAAAGPIPPAGEDEAYPSEARLLCWYEGPIALTEEDAKTAGSRVAQLTFSVVAIPIDTSGKPLDVAPTAIFRAPGPLPLVAPRMPNLTLDLPVEAKVMTPGELAGAEPRLPEPQG